MCACVVKVENAKDSNRETCPSQLLTSIQATVPSREQATNTEVFGTLGEAK